MESNSIELSPQAPAGELDSAGCAPMPGCVVWMVFKHGYPPEFQGVFREKSRAIEACRTPDHCVCPATMDEEIPQSTEDWKGAWYPGLQDDPHND